MAKKKKNKLWFAKYTRKRVQPGFGVAETDKERYVVAKDFADAEFVIMKADVANHSVHEIKSIVLIDNDPPLQ